MRYRHSRAAPLLVLIPLLTACADGPAESGPDGQITVAGEISAPRLVSVPGARIVECDLHVRATATGSRGAVMRWEGTVVRFYAGPDRQAPLDSVVLGKQDAQRGWQTPTIQPGITQTGSWVISAGIPFALDFISLYSVDGRAGVRASAPLPLTCGEPVPAGGGPAPTLTLRGITPEAEYVEPGSYAIRVTYSANSPLGIWETGLVVSGAFTDTIRYAEPLQRHAERWVYVRIPEGAPFGQQIALKLFVVDAAMKRSELVLPITPLVRDTTPPLLEDLRVEGHGGLAGRFDARDTLRLWLRAFDGSGLTHFVYEAVSPVAMRDSIRIESDYSQRLPLPLRPEWVGRPVFRFYVRDRAGHASRLVASQPGAFQLLPISPYTVHRVDPGASSFRDLMGDPARGLLLAARPQGVEVYALPGLERVRTSTAVADPVGADVLPDGSLLVAAHAGLHVVSGTGADESSRAVPFAVPAGTRIEAVRAFDGGRALVILRGTGDGTARVVEVDLATGAALARVPARAADSLLRLQRTEDRSRILFLGQHGCAVLVDVSGVVSPCAALESRRGVGMNSTGTRFVQGSRVYDEALRAVQDIPDEVRFQPQELARDGVSVWVAEVRGLTRVNLGTHEWVDRTLTGPAEVVLAVGSRFVVGIDRAYRAEGVTTLFAVEVE